MATIMAHGNGKRDKKRSNKNDKAENDKAERKSEGKSGSKNGGKIAPPLPKEIEPTVDAPPVELKRGEFDLDDPLLPDWVEAAALKSGGYPYDEPMKTKQYEEELQALQVELVKLQAHVIKNGLRLVLVFEGRDAAGKGGSIFAFRQYLNPRSARDVALPKPTETERGQWYFQRYVAELPTAGEIVTFDRSWYNRAGVEPVMGFCTAEEHKLFLREVPRFEDLQVEAGLILFKFWLDIGREMQLKRFHERRHNPLKIWKLSPMDYAALDKWDDYSRARDEMLNETHTKTAPWTVVLANDKRRARLNVIRHVLSNVDYAGRDDHIVRAPDKRVLGSGPDFLKRNK